MTDYITLLGSEDVRHAANTMQNAADRMNHAASQIDDSLFRHQQNMAEINRQHQEWWDDWLGRFEKVVTGSDMPAPATDFAPPRQVDDLDRFPVHPLDNGPTPTVVPDNPDDIPY